MLAASDKRLITVYPPLLHLPKMSHHRGKPWLTSGRTAFRPGRTQSTGRGRISCSVTSPNDSKLQTTKQRDDQKGGSDKLFGTRAVHWASPPRRRRCRRLGRFAHVQEAGG